MTESDYMPQIRANFAARIKNLRIKSPQAITREAEAYMQGVLAALTTTGDMTMNRAGTIAFLFSVGRGVEFLMPKPTEPAKAPRSPA